MMDPSVPMLENLDPSEELSALNGLFKQAEELLEGWNAYEPNRNPRSPDAVVALLALQSHVRERRSYLLGQLHQGELPF